MDRSFERIFHNIIPAQAFRELDNIYLRIWKEFVRLHTKKHQTDILRLHILRKSTDDVHIAAYFHEISGF